MCVWYFIKHFVDIKLTLIMLQSYAYIHIKYGAYYTDFFQGQQSIIFVLTIDILSKKIDSSYDHIRFNSNEINGSIRIYLNQRK